MKFDGILIEDSYGSSMVNETSEKQQREVIGPVVQLPLLDKKFEKEIETVSSSLTALNNAYLVTLFDIIFI